MLPNVERTSEELNAALQRRLESLVSDLLVIDGMTRRGAVLNEHNREHVVPPLIRLALRLLDALEKGEPAKQPWSAE